MTDKIKIGAVIYAPQVTIVWGIINDYFVSEGLDTECVYFKDYHLQVDALLEGSIDIAWNNPMAWLDAYIRSDGKILNGCMRDTDNGRVSYIVARKDSGISTIQDLKGKTIGFGCEDSAHARLIPIYDLHVNGLEYRVDYAEKRYDIGVGLYGDNADGELMVAREMMSGEIDATCIMDMYYDMWTQNGTIDEEQVNIVAKTPEYDHCIFSARPDFSKDLLETWCDALLRMDYNNPQHKEMMDLEGLKKWVPGRNDHFEQIIAANEYLHFFKEQ